MAQSRTSSGRDDWWEKKLKDADTPKAKVAVLQGKLLSDIAKLPEHQRDEARSLAAVLLEGVLDEIAIRAAEREWV